MAEYRKAAREDLAAIVDFINMVFSMAKAPHDFKTLLPKVYADDACLWADHYLAEANGRIEGVVACLRGEWSVLGESLPVGAVGSVSTYPYTRGAGHMKACMRMMLEDAAAQGLALLYLGGKRQRYEYFGFSQGGLATGMRFAPETFRHAWTDVDAKGVAFGEFAPWAARAKALYDQQPVRAERRAEDFAMIAASWHARPWAILRDGAFIGYLVASPDGGGISELGLEREEDCPAVLRAWFEAQGRRGFEIDTPVWDRERLRALARVAGWREQGAAEMFRVLDFPRVTRLFLTLKSRYARLADGRFVLQVEEEQPMTICVRGGEVSVETTGDAPDARLSRLEAQELLLSPMSWFDTAALPACVDSWFPLPITVLRSDSF